MALAEQISRFNNLNEWFNSPQGDCIAQAINEELLHLQDILYGNILIQLGSCGDNLWLSSLRFNYKWLFKPQIAHGNIHCASILNQLPIDRNSVDCIVSPFTVDAFKNQDLLLDEIDRVLKPMGYVIFIGINLLSFWGMWSKLSKYSCFGIFKGFPKVALSLKHTMLHRGYGQCYYNAFYFLPPIGKKYFLDKLAFLNQMGKMVSIMPSALYCLVMQKYVDGYTDPLFAIDNKKLSNAVFLHSAYSIESNNSISKKQ